MVKRLYTKNGDDGSTLIGLGKIPKNSHLIKTIGSLDSFVSSLDRCRLNLSPEYKAFLEKIQDKIINIAVELLMQKSNHKIISADIKILEKKIDELESPIPTEFIRFDNELSCDLNEARVRCREFERKLVGLLKENKISKDTYAYINRLSDLLFCLAFHYNR